MKLSFILPLAAGALALDVSTAENATISSLVYGLPLLPFEKYYAEIISTVGANTFSHSRQLSTPANRTIVRPNVDTLYSSLIFHLSQQNVEITIPDVPAEDFKLFSFYDPFGDNFANIGTSGFYKPGKYLLQMYDQAGTSAQVGLTNSTSGDYVGIVNSPTAYGILLVRWGPTPNLAAVYERQNESNTALVPITNYNNSAPSSPSLSSLAGAYSNSSSSATNILNLLANFAPPNGPTSLFSDAGVYTANFTYVPVPGVDLEQANATAVELVGASVQSPQNLISQNNDWVVLSPDQIGNYGTDYALRAAVASQAYLALRNPYSVYPIYVNKSALSSTPSSTSSSSSSAETLTLAADEALLVTFSYPPPLADAASFWSLTAYGADQYLIPNSEEVYALGDRSNLTFANGNLVYSGGSNTGNANETFQILLQPADVTPPANWTSNWLPAPTGGGGVIPQLRFYGGDKSLFDGSYTYPTVEKVAAITNGSGSSVTPSNGAAGNLGAHAVAVACVVGAAIALMGVY